MSVQNGSMKAILSAVVAMCLLLTACGSDADTAVQEAEDVPTVTEAEEAPAVEETEIDPVLETAVAGMTEAWGTADGVLAWTFDSERCRGGVADAPEGYVDLVAGWGGENSGATASNVTAVVDGERAAVSYDVHDGAGAFVAPYVGQPWVLADGNWFRDAC